VSFVTEPAGADVFIYEIFYGVTPLKINIADTVFKYRLEKKGLFRQRAQTPLLIKLPIFQETWNGIIVREGIMLQPTSGLIHIIIRATSAPFLV